MKGRAIIRLMKLIFSIIIAVFMGLFIGCEQHGHHHNGDGHDHDHDKDKKSSKSAGGEGKVAAKDTYPLDTCVVSGKKLGSMGDPEVIDHNGTTVKFCCHGCEDSFAEDPRKYIDMIVAAKEKGGK